MKNANKERVRQARKAFARLRKSYPLPEVLQREGAAEASDGEWIIHNAEQGATELRPGHMDVPLDARDAAAAWIRLHEMAHVKWSPLDVPAEHRVYYLGAEDARVNLALRAQGFSTATAITKEQTASILMACKYKQIAASKALAAVGTASEKAALTYVGKLYGADVRDAVVEAATEVRADVTSFESTVRAVDVLLRRLGELNRFTAPLALYDDAGGSCGRPRHDMAERHGHERPRFLAPQFTFKDYDLVGKIAPLQGTTHRVPWGTMTVEVAPLTARLPKAQRGRGQWRPTDCGAHPRRMERWAVDQGVFATRGRARGGTVLIDASGSMQLDRGDILACVTAAPAATIAQYSGHTHDGTLTILAQRGRRVSEVPRSDNGNVIDGPALRWLGTQRAPRIWVSDAGVTGIGDEQTGPLKREAADICATMGIWRVDTMDDAVDMLRGARR